MHIRYTLTKNVNGEYVITEVATGAQYVTADRVEANRKLTEIADSELCNVYHNEFQGNVVPLAIIA